MIARTLLLLLSAQLGLAQIHLAIDKHTTTVPSSSGLPPASGPPAGGSDDIAGINLGAVESDDDELEVVLTDQKIWLTINVTFGTGPEGEDEESRAARTHTLVLDSGSQDLWVMGAGGTSLNCNTNETTIIASGYTLAPSGVNTSTSWDNQYHGTSQQPIVTGFDVNDTMTLAGPEDEVDLTFSVANHVECLPIANNFQGVFPIGPSRYGIANDSSADSDPNKGPLRMLRKAGVINNEDIGFSLNAENPSLTIGGINEAFTYDSEAMANVTSTRFTKWVVPVDSIMAAGKSLASNATTRFLEAWIDTGVTYWSAPREMWQDFYQSIPGGMFLYDNEGKPIKGILPATPEGDDINVAITIGGKTFVMDYNSLINTDTPKFPNDNKDFRYGTLQISRVTDSPNQWVFGASFLEHVYVAFNPGWKRVCIWPLTDADKGTPPPPQNENKDEQAVLGPTHPWGETPEKTEDPVVAKETPAYTTSEEAVVTSYGSVPTQAPDQPTMTTSWSMLLIPTSTQNIVGHFTWDVTAMETTWVPIEVTVTPTFTEGPSETAPIFPEDPAMTTWESPPAQSESQNENSAPPAESNWVSDPSAIPSESWSAEQPAESNAEGGGEGNEDDGAKEGAST